MHHITPNQPDALGRQPVPTAEFLNRRPPLAIALYGRLTRRQTPQIRQLLLTLEQCDLPRQPEIAIEVLIHPLFGDDELSIELPHRQPIDRLPAQAVTSGVEIEGAPVVSI